jgi:hypothetical protein
MLSEEIQHHLTWESNVARRNLEKGGTALGSIKEEKIVICGPPLVPEEQDKEVAPPS